jgi:hypothetical protein
MATIPDNQPNYEKGDMVEIGQSVTSQSPAPTPNAVEDEQPKLNFGQKIVRELKTPGSALQIIIAAIFGIAIGVAVSATTNDIPEAAPTILRIPGTLWLRALRATGK